MIGQSDENIILGTYGVAFLPRRRTLIADKLENTVKCVDSAWHVVKQIGRRGINDGEFRGPGPIGANARFVAVADFNSRRVQVFTSSLDHRSTFRMDTPVFDILVDASDHLWIGKLPNESGETLVRVDTDGSVLAKIRVRHSTSDLFASVFKMSMSAGGRIVLAFLTRNVIEVWDTSGNFVREISIPDLPAKSPTMKLSQGLFTPDLLVPEDNIFTGIAADARGRLYVLADGFTEHPGRDIYVLESTGRLLCTSVLPRKSAGIFINGNNDLFSIEQDRTMVGVYRIGE